MPGTRLIIQATVVVQVALLALLAFWHGMCCYGDVSCRPIVDQGGKASLAKTLLNFSNHIPIQPITVIVPAVDREDWTRAWKSQSEDLFEVEVNEAQRLAVCADPELSATVPFKGGGIYVCHAEQDFLTGTTESSVFYLQGTGPEGRHEKADFERLVSVLRPPPQNRSILRKPFTFTLQIEDTSTSDWFLWTKAIQRWMDDHVIDMPYWRIDKPVMVNHVFGGTLSAQAKRVQYTVNNSLFCVSDEIMDSSFDCNPSVYEVLLYVPSKIPMSSGTPHNAIGQGRFYGTSKLVAFPQEWPLANNETDHFRIASYALSPYLSFLTSFVMELELAPLGDFVPQWCTDLYLQRVLRGTFGAVEEKAINLRADMLKAGSDVSISMEVVNKWQSVVAIHKSALTTLREHDEQSHCEMCTALNLLETALDILDEVEQDPTLVPPLHFPMDQTSAIFAPLLFPLLIPMLAGLRREYQRYNNHIKKVKDN